MGTQSVGALVLLKFSPFHRSHFQEYGITRHEKLTIAQVPTIKRFFLICVPKTPISSSPPHTHQGICAPLLRKIRADLQRNVDTSNSDVEDEAAVNRLDPRWEGRLISCAEQQHLQYTYCNILAIVSLAYI